MNPKVTATCQYRLTMDGHDFGLYDLDQLSSLHRSIGRILSQHLIDAQVPSRLRALAEFISFFCEEAGIDTAGLVGPRRTSNLCWKRHIAIVLAGEFVPGSSSVDIGCAFNRDHGSILHARAVVASRLSIDKFARAEFDHLRARTQARISQAQQSAISATQTGDKTKKAA